LRASAVATALAVGTLGAALATPESSHAGTYQVASCGDVWRAQPVRNGFLPFSQGTWGWQRAGQGAGQGGVMTGCDADNPSGYGRGLWAQLSGTWSQRAAASVGWRFVAPPDTTITRYTARFRPWVRPWHSSHNTWGDVSFSNSTQTDPNYDYRMQGSYGPDNSLEERFVSGQPSGGASFIQFTAGCSAPDLSYTCPAGGTNMATMLMQASLVELEDNHSPQIANVSGDFADSRYINAKQSKMGVSASITDRGAGIRDYVLEERNSVNAWWDRLTIPADSNGGRCVIGGGHVLTGLPQGAGLYTVPQPCRTDASGDLEIDTSMLAEGERTLRLTVRDAALNTATVVGQRNVIVDRTAPTVTFEGTPDACTTGSRALVQAEATDATSGVQALQTIVASAKGAKVPVAADGTIECPAESAGPLAVTTTATDKAGNEKSVTRAQTVAVKAAPTPPAPIEDVAVGGGIGDTATVKPADPTPTPVPAPAPAPAPQAPTPAPSPAPNGRGAATAELLACTKKDVVLTEAFPSGKKDVLRGVANARYVGQTVTIVYGAGRKVVSRVPVGIDGSFTATVKAPKGKSSRGDSARYQAIVGGERSSTIKRLRRMYATQAYRTANGGAIYVAGRVTKPFRAGSTVTIQTRSAGCGPNAWHTVKRTKIDARGNYGAQFPVASSEQAVVVRALAKVRPSAKTVRLSRTQSLPTAVQMR
jgi:hypothetical protein